MQYELHYGRDIPTHLLHKYIREVEGEYDFEIVDEHIKNTLIPNMKKQPNTLCMVVEYGGAVVGFALVATQTTFFIPSLPKYIQTMCMYVEKKHRRTLASTLLYHGIARTALLNKCGVRELMKNKSSTVDNFTKNGDAIGTEVHISYDKLMVDNQRLLDIIEKKQGEDNGRR